MRKMILVTAGLAAAAAAGAWAANSVSEQHAMQGLKEEVGASLDAPSGKDAEWRREAARLEARAARTEALDVGDADSFGKPMKWLGLMVSPPVTLRADCTLQPGEQPDRLCLQTDPSWGRVRGELRDVARMTLPGRSLETTLCHWQTPLMFASFHNNAGWDNRTVWLRTFPSITVENEVLNAAGLIDPATGEALGGRLEMYASSASVDSMLDSDERAHERLTATRTCIGGYLTRRVLKDHYGLSDAQVREFFAKPTTLRLNLSVSGSGLDSGMVQMSYRWVGH